MYSNSIFYITMKQLFDTDEMIGKTIKTISAEYEEQLIIVFSDESFIVLSDDRDEYDRSSKAQIGSTNSVFDTNVSRLNYELLYKLGMITKYVFDELDPYFKKMDEDEEVERQEYIQQKERQQLAQLKAKYEK